MKKMSIPDEECGKIFLTLVIENINGRKKIRFNKLHDRLADLGSEMPKSTLSGHLKHLTDAKMVVRNVEDVQKVSYEINMKGIANVKEVIKQSLENKKLFDKGRESFFSEPLNVQINDILYWSSFMTLLRLKHWILYKTYGKYEDGIGFQFADSKLNKAREMDVVRKAIDDEQYRTAILEALEDTINKWRKEL